MLVGASALAVLPANAGTGPAKPTIVLVHGAMTGSGTWNSVIPRLMKDGFKAVAVADPLRSLSGDAAYVASFIRSIPGPVVLVGHSYGGSVITNAAVGSPNIKALVYVSAFAPAAGESAFELVGKYPGSELGAALAAPVSLPDGSHDLIVDPARFIQPFAADLPKAAAELLAATQRPVNEKALKEPSPGAAWKTLPSFFIYGSADKSLPPALQSFMATRAVSRETVIVPGASHLLLLSHPDKVVSVIEAASRAE